MERIDRQIKHVLTSWSNETKGSFVCAGAWTQPYPMAETNSLLHTQNRHERKLRKKLRKPPKAVVNVVLEMRFLYVCLWV